MKDLEFCNNLIVLLESGFNLGDSLQICGNKFATNVFIENLNLGHDFIAILRQIDFDPDGILIMEIGIKSKDFISCLKQTRSVLESKVNKQKEIIELIKYPIMLLVISIIATLFVIFFLIPQFEKILSSMGAATTGVTLIFQIFKLLPFLFVICLLISIGLWLYFYSLSQVKRILVIFKFKFFRKFYISIYNQVFATVIADLALAGLSMQNILNLLANQHQNPLLAYEARKIACKMNDGISFHQSLTKTFYEQELIEIIKIGEEFGLLAYYLQSYCQYITIANNKRTRRFIFWLQPIFYLVFGILILGLYAAIFIPMFALMDSI